MQPTEVLKNEHQTVLTVLDLLEKVGTKIRSGQEIKTEYLDQLLKILKEYVDHCHHGKEEKILFPSLERLGLSRQNGPVGVMLMEHDNGRQYIREMNNAVLEYKAGDREALRTFAANASYYATLMGEHIYKENNILYPIADLHLSKEELTAMLEDFALIEKETIGTGKQEEYLLMITSLQNHL